MKQSSHEPANKSPESEKSPGFLPFSEKQFQQFLELAPVPAFVADPDDNFTFVNLAACRFLGYEREELAGKNFAEIIHSRELPRLASAKHQLLEGLKDRSDWEFLRKDGSSAWGEVSSSILPDGRRQIFVSDLTGYKWAEQSFLESEEQRWQSQKIEALGTLAGGIAHDFNNFLAVIMLHIDMLNLQMPANSPLRHRIDEIKTVTNDAARMVRQLLAIGRKQTLQPQPVGLNQVVKEFSKILPSLIGKNIELQLALEPALGTCFVDPNQIIQVLINLALNAAEAMPAAGGVLKIETANIVLDKKTVKHKSQSNGSYIQMIITDNGLGMDLKTAEHIFEPFFTTKESSKGAGLGLATAYGIVKQSKGFIWTESKINQGTTFRIEFPRIDQPDTVAATPRPPADNQMPTGDETILLVEDEELVRRITVEILKDLGYRVFEASGGTEALEFAGSFDEPIDLLLTDMMMPQMNGSEVAEKITALHPETTVLFMSGDGDDQDIAGGGSKKEFLGKPFSPTALAVKVREILES